MPVRVIPVDPMEPETSAITEAARAIRRGELVAFPTETVYGLGADGTNPQAAARIFRAKGRPQDNPLILHVASPGEVLPWVEEAGQEARRLMDLFWPGPLTLVLPRSPSVPDIITAGLATVAVRMPAHPVALALIRASGVPIAAPSANLSGRPSPTSAAHVQADLGDAVTIILDGGGTAVGLESTVLDLTVTPPTILRPGAVTLEELQPVLGEVEMLPEGGEKRTGRETAMAGGNHIHQGESPARSPGLKYRHYAPRAPLFLVAGDSGISIPAGPREGPMGGEESLPAAEPDLRFGAVAGTREDQGESRPDPLAAKVLKLAREQQLTGKKVGILSSVENAPAYAGYGFTILVAGSRRRLPEVAARLFALLRAFDETGVDVIIAEAYPAEGVGAAIMNRLSRAAEGRIL